MPLNPAFKQDELDYFIDDAKPQLIVSNQADTFCLDHSQVIDISTVEIDTYSIADVELMDGSDTACMLYTSGTTGRPKGALRSHDNLLNTATVLADIWKNY